MDTQAMSIKCSQCGSGEFSFPPELQPEDTVACTVCGATEQVEVIREQIREQAREQAIRAVREAFKGRSQ